MIPFIVARGEYAMSTEATLAEVEACRAAMHRIVDAQFDLVTHCLRSGGPLPKERAVLPLSTLPAVFKGKKPTAVIFPNGREVKATNWRLAVTIVLQDCFNTPELRERLMSIRGKVFGRQRVLLGDTPSDMIAPLEISEGLYLESRFDTESLLYVLTRRVLAPVGYNYNEVLIQLRS